MSATELPIGREVRLDDRYRLAEGEVLMTGVQAIIRLILDQMREDRAGGLHTGALVSGYQGSPLAGLDLELARQRALCAELEVVHRPGLNEELGATAVWGSQLVPSLPDPQVDGVLGVWYGKAPGVDRSGDALRHGNFAGAHPRGGLLALCGDDPSCKSSTLPSASESLLAALRMPVVYPGSPQEVLELGRHAIYASRASGTWVGLKIATNVADALATVRVGAPPAPPEVPVVEFDGRPYVHAPAASLAPPASTELERTLLGPRLALARAYARLNDVNRIAGAGTKLGVVACGPVWYDLQEALALLGVGPQELDAHGLRLLKLGMPWPLEPEIVHAFADGLESILVLEEKGPFLETTLRHVLYGRDARPRVLGESDEDGAPLVPPTAFLDPTAIARLLAPRLARGAAQLAVVQAPAPPVAVAGPRRTPFFCSGCPHNRSTEVPEGGVVGAGIGCHGMIAMSPAGKGLVTGLTQMGGEGAQWIGQAPFTGTRHLFQNLGDGTFTHSGSLAIRAAVAAGVNITYKLLYNGAVAMTGGQDVEGSMPVPDLTRWLALEGVKRVIVTTDEPERYRGVRLDPIAELRPRAELLQAQRDLRAVEGVTVLIHDQRCAAERRRLRKRGKLPDPVTRIAINERVCEGCGDCGRKSHCLSVLPVDTEFGAKTRIHQPSCNKDYSCVDGDCPSFLKVIPARKAERAIPAPPEGLPEREPVLDGDVVTLRLIGIGGTGVVTISQVLAMAALLDGKRTLGLDQTGLAQKGGPVVSDVRIVADERERSQRAAAGTVDAYLGFDLVGATNPVNLATAAPGRTVAVISTTEVPTGQMIGDPLARFPALERQLDAIDAMTTPARNVHFDAMTLAEALFDDSMPANALVLGAAWQRGLVPVSLAAIEEAFRLNGAAVEKNLSAFHWGRAVVAAPDAVERATRPAVVAAEPSARARAIAEATGAAPGSELERLVRSRADELIAYQDERLAERYGAFVGAVLAADRRDGDGSERVTLAVARQLYKLLAYKDEYEVARLHLDPAERARLRAEFGEQARFRYQLHPPLLRALGMQRKLSLGPWFDPAFRLLRALRRLRGTPLDVFGIAKVRRVERALPGEYRALVERTLPQLGEHYETVLALCELPDQIRGYEEVKLSNVATFRMRAVELEAHLSAKAVAH